MIILLVFWIFIALLLLLFGGMIMIQLGIYIKTEKEQGNITQQSGVTCKAVAFYTIVLFSVLWPLTAMVFLMASLFWEEKKQLKS